MKAYKVGNDNFFKSYENAKNFADITNNWSKKCVVLKPLNYEVAEVEVDRTKVHFND